jgi:hypothetical protein
MTDGAMERLARLDFVTSVNVCGARALTDDGVLHLARMPQLEELSVGGGHAPLTDRGLAALRHLPRLRRLAMCWAQGVTDAGAANLAPCERLESVDLMGTPTGDGALRALRGKERLGDVKTGRAVTDAGVRHLHDFPALRQLMPMDVTDAGFRHVGACRGPEDLWCMYCRDTGDQATEHVAGLSLRSYYAGKTRITDRSLELLGRMTSLERVELWETEGITDAGIAALHRLPRLRQVEISGAPRVTRRGVAGFAPGVRVVYGG